MKETLSEQFFKHCDDEYGCQYENAYDCAEIAGNFAVDFALWIVGNMQREVDFEVSNPTDDMLKLLSIYKKENNI